MLALVPATARATYSICATDTAARQVGGSGTSCVAPSSVYVIYGSAPGHGVVHAQAFYNETAKLEAVDELNMDVPPADIIVNITDPAFDPLYDLRQYGVVDLMGRAAGFTGALTTAYAEDRQGLTGTFPYSVQGNILTSVAVIDNTEDAFVNGGGCDLADRLMLALEGGEQNGEGDSRCTPDGVPSDSAFIQVDLEGMPAGSYLYLEFTASTDPPPNPITELRSMYDSWRATHPCPSPPDGGVAMDGGTVPDGPGPDMGGGLDAGVLDMGGGLDTGGVLDMSGGPDVGTSLDMGSPLDTGGGLESGTGADSGLPPDGGTGADLGAPQDGASSGDAGSTQDLATMDVGAGPGAETASDGAPEDDPTLAPEGAGAGGCACRAGGAPARAAPIWLLVALLLRRRR